MAKQIPFTKMVGTGNDFIVVESRRASGVRWPDAARAWCDRHNGIGADGVLLLEPSRSADARMRIFNADGSEAEMCGNGARCVALYLSGQRNGHGRGPVTLETKAGTLEARVRGPRVAMRMTDPRGIRVNLSVAAGGRTVTGTLVNTGVPHFVVAVPKVAAVDVRGLGRALREHRRFAPRGTNVDFIQAGRPLLVRTYERGVEDETLACGTGIAASAIAHALARGARGAQRVELQPKSGDRLTVSFRIAGAGAVHDVVLDGPARRVFDGTAEWPRGRN